MGSGFSDQHSAPAAPNTGVEHALEHAGVAVQVANGPPQEGRGVPHAALCALPAAELCAGRTFTAPARVRSHVQGGACALTTAPVRKIGLLYFQEISSTSLHEHCDRQQAGRML